MLLIEAALSDEELEQRFGKLVVQHGQQVIDGAPKGLNEITDQMIKRFPQFEHQGSMYRVLYIPKDVILQASQSDDVLKHIKQRNNESNYVSWSNDIRGVIRYMNLTYTSDPLDRREDNVGVFIEQQGTGFDLREWVADLFHARKQGGPGFLYPSVQVFEVLARPTDNISITFYAAPNEHDKGFTKFTPNNFDKLQQFLKGQAESGDHIDSDFPHSKAVKKLHRDRRKAGMAGGSDELRHPLKPQD